MAKASKDRIEELETRTNLAAEGLPNVTARNMFGCHALFADGNVFGLVWKGGRIGVRLPDDSTYNKLMSQTGAAPWKAGKMTMKHWVFVPEGMHQNRASLRKWLKIGHGLAMQAKPRVPKRPA
jgi:TfoX/Sxy family transcriptional regulator of competence genes